MGRISVRKDDLQPMSTEATENRTADLGGYTVDFASIKAGFKLGADLFDGLPGSACQCPHWGVLLKGELRIPFADGTDETVRAGEAYHLPPGHHYEVVEDCEYIEFSPTTELMQTYEVVARNMGAQR